MLYLHILSLGTEPDLFSPGVSSTCRSSFNLLDKSPLVMVIQVIGNCLPLYVCVWCTCMSNLKVTHVEYAVKNTNYINITISG